METKELIKAEIREYMRMLQDMEFNMSSRTNMYELKNIAAKYGIPGNILKLFVEHKIIFGHNLPSFELYKGSYDEEFKLYTFHFMIPVSYLMADSLRLWFNHEKQIKLNSQHTLIDLYKELEEEDRKMQPRCEHCKERMFRPRLNKHYCSDKCRRSAWILKRKRIEFHEQMEIKKRQSWWYRAMRFLSSIVKSNPKII